MDLLKRRNAIVLETLEYHPLNLPHKLAVEVINVLEYGANKHGETDKEAIEHIEHAMEHLKSDGIDRETGKTDLAHAIARCMLAIERIGRDYA